MGNNQELPQRNRHQHMIRITNIKNRANKQIKPEPLMRIINTIIYRIVSTGFRTFPQGSLTGKIDKKDKSIEITNLRIRTPIPTTEVCVNQPLESPERYIVARSLKNQIQNHLPGIKFKMHYE